MNPKSILYIAMSLDGYIAKADDNIDFLSIVEKDGEDYGYTNFVNSVDTVIMGRKTYDKILSLVPEFPHKDKETYIITHNDKASLEKIKFYTGNLKELITTLKGKVAKDIFIDGGAEIVNELLKDNLIDEFYISIIPILLGNGISLFQNRIPEFKLQLISSKAYEKGLVQLHYKVI